MTFPRKVVVALHTVVDYGVLTLAILLEMFFSVWMLFGVMCELVVFLSLYVMKLMDSCF
jgi:hypothetical protein